MGQYTSYWLYQKYETRDDQTIPVYPNVWSVDADGTMDAVVKLDNDPACGYDPRPVEYRWVNLNPSTDYYCDECEAITVWEKSSDTVCVEDPTPPGPTPSPYANQYFTVIPEGNGRIRKVNHDETFYYSTDSGSTWRSSDSADSISMTAGNKIMFKGELTPKIGAPRYYGIGVFSASTDIAVEGNPMSLLYGDNFRGQTDLTGKDYAFFYLFSGCTGLTSIDNLALPATTLSPHCYWDMFSGCKSLTSIPSGLLPAPTLVDHCYSYMFAGCTSLTSIPSGFLPATTLANYCYLGMFNNCSRLTTVPTDLLPVTTLASGCYSIMFIDCTSLTTAPVLPATTLVNSCYEGMFEGCTSLSSITCPATDISAESCTSGWVNYVPSYGTFYKNSSMSSWSRDNSGIPDTWYIFDYQS